MSLMKGMRPGGDVDAIRIDRLGNVQTIPSVVVPTVPDAGPRRRWEPWDLEVTTVGADSRYRLWRYIMPGTDTIYSKWYPMEGCTDLTLIIQCGAVTSGTPSLTVNVSGSCIGGADGWNNAFQINSSTSSANVITTSGAATYLIISTTDKSVAGNEDRRGITYPFWGFWLDASAAGIPVTIWAEGR